MTVENREPTESGINYDSMRMYLDEISALPPLPAEREAELFKRVRRGDMSAKRELIECNLRLVVAVAKRYTSSGMALGDIIQEGNLGLIKAIDKFDGALGFRLSTYAIWWIKQTITRAIANKARIVRLPVRISADLCRYRQAENALMQQLGRMPDGSEVAEKLGLPPSYAAEIAAMDNRAVPLDQAIDEALSDDAQRSAMLRDRRESITKALATLTPREQSVLRLRYGIDDGTPRTLEEVGSIFRVTRERIRQIESKALRKLRSPQCRELLEEWR